MLQIAYNILRNHYPSEEDQPALFKEIGWDDLVKNSAYRNTCATRLSLALIRSGITIPGGRMAIKAGPLKGKLIEPGQVRLSHILELPTMFGKPEVYGTRAALGGIAARHGIVSFFRLIPGIYDGGHIDIIGPDGANLMQCGHGCYWMSETIWFWPLK